MDKINVQVDKRIELLFIMLSLTDYPKKYQHARLVANYETYPFLCENNKTYPYFEDIKNHFKDYKNHPAISVLNKIVNGKLNFSYDAPVALFLNLDKDYNFQGFNEYPFVNILHKSPEILEFLSKVKDFVNDTNFENFYEQHKEFYQSELDKFHRIVPYEQILSWMKEFFKDDLAAYEFNINLSPLMGYHGFGDRIKNAAHCTAPIFFKDESKYNLKYLPIKMAFYLHEFCHSFINPLTEKYYDQIQKPELSLQEKETLKNHAYPHYEEIINEYIIRAIEILYLRDQNYDENEHIAVYEGHGFNRKNLIGLANKMDSLRKNPNFNFEKEYVNIASSISKTNKEKV